MPEILEALTPTIGVVGGGTMGVGIAYVFAVAGWQTTVVEPDEARARAVLLTIGDTATQGVTRGKLTEDQATAVSDSVHRVASIAELQSGLGLIVETVPERFQLKQQVLAEIERRHPEMIATNTSALSIDALATALARPTCFLGMHFFNPVWSLPMVELVRGAATSDATVERAQRIAIAIGKETITVTDRYVTIEQPGGGRAALPLDGLTSVTVQGDAVHLHGAQGELTFGFVRGRKALRKTIERVAPAVTVAINAAAACPT